MAGLLRFFGIQGTSDGTPTGTPSVLQVVSGVASVALSAAQSAVLTAIKTAVEKLATEVAVGDGLRVKQETANKLNCTEASGATIAANTLAAVRGAASYKSAVAEACASVKATAGYLNSGMVYNSGGDPAYVQFHDLAAAPAGGAVPALVVGKVASGDTVQWPACVPGTTGLQVCLSSTKDTYTAYAFGHFFFWRD